MAFMALQGRNVIVMLKPRKITNKEYVHALKNTCNVPSHIFIAIIKGEIFSNRLLSVLLRFQIIMVY